MNHPVARTRIRGAVGAIAICLLLAAIAVIGTLASQPAEWSATPFGDDLQGQLTDTPALTDRAVTDAAVTEDDGAVPDGVTVFDDRYPAVANLDAVLLRALRQAATEAARDGVALDVNSGWRSPEYQNQLLREAVTEYGSEEEAARWVATADKSAHVSGDAVDIGSSVATAWLSQHGAAYGLCEIYGNEPWHFEFRPEAIERGCPPMFADATKDPRMHQ